MGQGDDIIDAEFVSLPHDKVPSTPLPQPGESAYQRARETREKADVADESQLGVFGKRDRKPAGKPMSLPLFTLIAILATTGAFLAAGGYTLFMPADMAFANAGTPVAAEQVDNGPLRFENVISNIDNSSGRAVFNLRAVIANHGDEAVVVPPVLVSFGDDPQTRRLFRINRGETLAPGEKLIFTNRIAAGDMTTVKPRLEFGN